MVRTRIGTKHPATIGTKHHVTNDFCAIDLKTQAALCIANRLAALLCVILHYMAQPVKQKEVTKQLQGESRLPIQLVKPHGETSDWLLPMVLL